MVEDRGVFGKSGKEIYPADENPELDSSQDVRIQTEQALFFHLHQGRGNRAYVSSVEVKQAGGS